MSPLYVARTGRYGRHVDVLAYIRDGLWMAFQMAWEVWWALVLGFLLSATVQAWVPRARMEHALGGFLNIVFTGVAAALVAFTLRRGANGVAVYRPEWSYEIASPTRKVFLFFL